MVQNSEIYYITPARTNTPLAANVRLLFIDGITQELKVKLSDGTTRRFNISMGGFVVEA